MRNSKEFEDFEEFQRVANRSAHATSNPGDLAFRCGVKEVPADREGRATEKPGDQRDEEFAFR